MIKGIGKDGLCNKNHKDRKPKFEVPPYLGFINIKNIFSE